MAAILVTLACAPSAGAVSPRQLVEAADFDGITVSPDGRRIAYRIERASIERNTYDSQWYVQDLDGTSPPLRVADGGVPLREQAGLAVLAPATWSPDGRHIYFRALIDGKVDVWRAQTDGSGAAPLTHDLANVQAFSLGADGRELLYQVGATRAEVMAAEQAEYDRGIHIDRTVPLGQGLFRSGFVEGRLATQRLKDNEVLRYPMLADAPAAWKSLDLATGRRRELASTEVPPPPLAVSDLPGQSDDVQSLSQDPASGRIALLTRVGKRDGLRYRPHVELSMLADRRARTRIECRDALCTGRTISAIQWRPGTDEVLFTVGDYGDGFAQSIFRWNVKSGKVLPVVHSAGLLDGGLRLLPSECGVTPVALACVVSEADRPPRLERIDIDSGARRVLFDPNPALAKDMAKTPVRLMRWTDARGQQFTGQYYPARRSGKARPPLFVNYYWCRGFVRGGLGDELPFSSLAENGISALCINYGPPREDGVEQYEQGRSAIESVVELLSSTGEIDPAKVGMGGLSFGAEITMWTAMHSRVLAAASVSSLGLSPMYYLLLSHFGDKFHERLRMGWQLGSPDETPERWRRFSPVFNLDRIEAPVLMQLPEQEYIHSLDYAVPLMRDGKADMYVFPNEPHQKFQPRHKLAVYQRNLDWFRFWLQGYEDPDPAKREQYVRWHAMKGVARKAP